MRIIEDGTADAFPFLAARTTFEVIRLEGKGKRIVRGAISTGNQWHANFEAE